MPRNRIWSWKLISLLLVFSVLISSGFYYWHSNQNVTPVPDKFKIDTSFQMYYPKSLPNGFLYEEIAHDEETQVVTYSITSGERRLYFSLQAKPKNLDLHAFNREKITGGRTFETKIGTLTTGVFENQTVGSIITENSWILITAGPGTSLDDIETISKTMQQP